jgi:hypothetical protein
MFHLIKQINKKEINITMAEAFHQRQQLKINDHQTGTNTHHTANTHFLFTLVHLLLVFSHSQGIPSSGNLSLPETFLGEHV